MRLPRFLAFAVLAPLIAGACAAEPVVTARRADRIAPSGDGPALVPEAPGTTSVEAPPVPTDPDATGSGRTGAGQTGSDPSERPATTPSTTAPPASAPPATEPPDPVVVDPNAIDFGIAKPAQPYDDFLLATIADVEAWWTEQFPAVYGSTFQPLEGRIIAAYPGRPDDIPGCGTPRTTYQEVRDFAAFYCGAGDFMVYDDGDGGLLAGLADRFGPAAIAIVLAHEYGHAIQLRIGALDADLATILTEQQADCFAGAWSARAATGGSPLVRFTDDDVRAGLISMLEVRDPVGLDQFSEGGHGSGFDRVGAFQAGFVGGVARCESLLREPLPLSPSGFDFATGGNARWGYGDQELFGMLTSDLNLYWGNDAGGAAGRFEPIALAPVQSPAEVDCDRLSPYFEYGAAICLDDASDRTVYVDEPAAFELYRQDLYGDFSVGYLLGLAWAEAAQRTLGSTRTGEDRELFNDCLTGAWVQTDIAIEFVLPEPRHPERTMQISPGDLDETVRTMILIGDAATDEDVLGTPFEKVAAFRNGLLGGVDACGG